MNCGCEYTEGPYLFYRSATLTMEQEFSDAPACATSHNPGIFIKLQPEHTTYEYGIFDYEVDPGQGWELLCCATTARAGSCCVALPRY